MRQAPALLLNALMKIYVQIHRRSVLTACALITRVLLTKIAPQAFVT
jgi:hypothetical protein